MSPAIENNVYALLEGVGSCGSISVQDPASPSWKLQTTVREGFRPLPVPARSVASVVSNSVWPCGRSPARLLCPWDSQGKNTGVGCHFLLQRIFLTQGSNPCLLWLWHCRCILYCWASLPTISPGRCKDCREWVQPYLSRNYLLQTLIL